VEKRRNPPEIHREGRTARNPPRKRGTGEPGEPGETGEPGEFEASPMSQAAAVYRLLLRTISTRGRLVGFAAISLIGLFVAWRVGSTPRLDPARSAIAFVDVFSIRFLIPVAALVFGTAALGDPTEDATLGYLWLRPVPRWRLAVAAAAAALTFVLPLGLLMTVLSAEFIAGDAIRAGAVGAAAVAAVAYTAWFVLLGAVTNRALVWGICYLLIVESFVARGGRSLGAISIQSYAVSILDAQGLGDLRLAYFSALTGVGMGGVLTIVALALTTWRLRHADVP
jgi:hypothetical protein